MSMRLIPEYLYQELIKSGQITDETFDPANIEAQEKRRIAIDKIIEKLPVEEREGSLYIIEGVYDHPKTEWNENLEFVFNGKVLEGSNIIELCRILNKRPTKPVLTAFEFFKTLQEILILEHTPISYLRYIGFPYSWTDAEDLDGLKINDDDTPT